MLSLALGFFSSFMPNILEYFQIKADNAHEIAMIKEARETQIALGNQKLEMVQTTADSGEIIAGHKSQTSMAKKAGGFILKLSASIRPVVTYAFVAEFLIITWSIAYLTIDQSGIEFSKGTLTKEEVQILISTLNSILDQDFMDIIKTLLGFWFGNRTFGKRVK